MKKFLKATLTFLLVFCATLLLFACADKKKGGIKIKKEGVVINAPDSLVFYAGLQDKSDFKLEKFARAIDFDRGEPIEITTDHIINYNEINLDAPDTYDVEYVVKGKGNKKYKHIMKLYVKDGSKLAALPTLDELKLKSKSEPIKVKLWHANGDTISSLISFYANGQYIKSDGKVDETVKKLSEAFEDTKDIKSFENFMSEQGVNVKIEVTKNGKNYEELLKNATTALGGGDLPDLIQGYPDHIYGYNNGGYIEKLGSYIYSKQWGYGYNNGIPTDEKGYDDFYTPYRLEQTISNNIGETLSIPFQKSTEVLVYNKDLLSLAGVTKVPETWDGIMEVARKVLKVKDAYIDSLDISAEDKKTAKENFIPFTYDSGNAFITLLKQFGGVYTSRKIEETKAKGKADFLEDAATTDMLLQVGQWAREGLLSNAKKWGTDYSSDKFKSYTVAMIISSSAGVKYNNPYTNDNKYLFDAGIAPVPYVKDYNRNYMQQGPGFSVVSHSKSTAESKLVAWLFLKYLTSTQIQSHFSRVTGYSPVRKSVSDQPTYQSFLSKSNQPINIGKEEAQNILIASELKIVTENTNHMVYDLPFTGSSECRGNGKTIFDRIILLGKDKNIVDEINQALADAKSNLASIIK